MRKEVREQEAKMRAAKHSGLKEVPAARHSDPKWADHKPVNPKHLEDDK